MRFFNLGATEVFLILIFAILAIGPQETIKYARQARELLENVRGVFTDLTDEVGKALDTTTEERK